MAGKLRSRAEEDEIVDGERLVARDRCAGRLKAGNGFAISRASNTRNQVTTISIRASQCRESSAGADL